MRTFTICTCSPFLQRHSSLGAPLYPAMPLHAPDVPPACTPHPRSKNRETSGFDPSALLFLRGGFPRAKEDSPNSSTWKSYSCGFVLRNGCAPHNPPPRTSTPLAGVAGVAGTPCRVAGLSHERLTDDHVGPKQLVLANGDRLVERLAAYFSI